MRVPAMDYIDRRRFQRVRLIKPASGRIGEVRVAIADLSLCGLRLLHQAPLPPIGTRCEVMFSWEGETLHFNCIMVRSFLRQAPRSALDKPLYESGLSIEAGPESSLFALRSIVEAHVMRALDERKANARGIPPSAAQSFQTGKGDRLTRHEFVNGAWRSSPTTDTRQPMNGFTISADEPLQNIEMLRTTYASSDAEGRMVIRQMASLSIGKTEGIPTRRYDP